MPNAANVPDEPEQTPEVATTSRPSPVHRAEGVTASERYLNKLCDRSFLTLWSYPGPFREWKTSPDKKSEGKELCDVLVVFESDVIIFSDKDIAFPDTGNLQTDWRRWYQKSIKASADQIFGAERWLRTNPNKVFLNQTCTQPFPYPIPAPDVARYHRVVVAKGCAKRCQKYFNPDAPWAGIGSLVVDSTLHSDDHLADFADPTDLTNLSGGRPFTVGHVDIKRGFVHVLDETTLDKLLTHLDTVADFVAYLTKKERLLTNHRVMASGEEELLGYYLGHVNAAGQNDFPPQDEFLSAIFGEGIWLRYLNGPERAAQVEADQPSYIWDEIIEHSSAWLRTGNSELSFHDHERLLRFFAREPRLRRRLLGRSILDLVTRARAEINSNPRRLIEPLKPDDPYFAIQILPVPVGLENTPGYEANYHEVRRKYLEAVCMAAKIAQPKAKIIVGYSVGPGRLPCEMTEDLLYVDTTIWTEDDYREAESLRHDLALWVDVAYSHTTERTFPVPRPLIPMILPKKAKAKKSNKHR